MKKFGFLLLMVSLMFACNAPAEKENSSDQTDESTVLTVDEVLASADEYLEKEIVLKGMVTHVCKHGGQKLFVAGKEEGIALRINTSEDIAEFSLDMEGSEVEFTGVFKIMTNEFKEQAIAEHNEHHGEEAEEEQAEEQQNHPDDTTEEKSYYIVAKSFKTI